MVFVKSNLFSIFPLKTNKSQLLLIILIGKVCVQKREETKLSSFKHKLAEIGFLNPNGQNGIPKNYM